MPARDDSETVLSIHHRSGTLMLSTTAPGLAARCTAKWGKGEVFNDEDGKPHRWVWRDLEDGLIRMSPQSKADVDARSERSRKQYQAKVAAGTVFFRKDQPVAT